MPSSDRSPAPAWNWAGRICQSASGPFPGLPRPAFSSRRHCGSGQGPSADSTHPEECRNLRHWKRTASGWPYLLI